MAKRKKEERSLCGQEWLLTYSDMITLLFTFFVLLLSLCSLEAGKIKQFQSACVEAMGALYEGQLSEVEFRVMVSSKKIIDKKLLETENILKQFSGLKTKLLQENEQGNLEFKEEEKGLCIIMKDDLLFPSGSAEITSKGRALLRELGKAFEKFEGNIVVEGHTDNIPIRSERFPSNWELSTSRAVSVVMFLSEEVGVNPQVFSAIGYGETKPRVANDTPDNRAKNRRVEIILVPLII